ncbi:MAG: FAD-linked oxidase C-terminal domain-containing protein [Sandaracinaceae bacterium]
MRPLPAASERATLALERSLPSGAVCLDRDVREAHARDESETEPTLPDAVIRVSSTEQVAAVMRAAHAHQVPVTPRAAGTGRTGGAVPLRGGWVMSFEGFGGIDEIHRGDGVAVVRPGLVLADLHAAVEAEGLFYPPDPNSLASCTLGGNIAENAGGPRAFKYGVTGDYVLGLEAVMADGTVLELGRRTKKGVTGYDLTRLIVGSEGTLALVTRATLHLVPKPEALRTMVVFLPSAEHVAPVVSACLGQRVVPRCVELLDAITLEVLREEKAIAIPDAARALLLVEIDGEDAHLDAELERLGNAMSDAGALEILFAKHGGDRERLWGVRREMSRALRRRAVNKLSEDVVVPRSRIGALLAKCREISDAHDVTMPSYGHAGDGNLHVNFLWDTPEEKPRVDAAIEALFRATIALGGTLSGEHGIGALKAPYLGLEQSPDLIRVQEGIKAQLDPRGVLNPGKIFPRPGHRSC